MKTRKFRKGKNGVSGFKCVCGTWRQIPVYVFAHMTDTLIGKCPSCGVKTELFDGVATIFDDHSSTPSSITVGN